ncbi:MAG: hypothetical protein M0Q87_15105, partial [Ottowia sp.]|nr:hypothetical protein [Ottowia sp.]
MTAYFLWHLLVIARVLAFFNIHPSGEDAMRLIAQRWTRHAALLRLADSKSAALSPLQGAPQPEAASV